MSYACDLCTRTFNYPSILKIHYRWSHTGEKPFRCLFCSELFSHEVHLIVHKYEIHSQKEHVCELCNKTFLLKSALEKHTELHKNEAKNKEFVSEGFCSENGFNQFSHEGPLIVHNRIHSQKEQYVCEFCNKTFLRKSSWEEHTEWHKSEAKNKSFVMEGFCNENGLDRQNVILKLYRCVICEEVFSKECDLNRHSLSHQDEKPPSKDKCHETVSMESKYSIPSRTRRKQRSFICDACGELFSEEKRFKAHKSECNIRDKSSSWKCYILNPQRRANSNEKHFDCDVCGKVFSRKDHLNTHRRIHTHEKPFECDVCGKSFSRKDKLNLHTRVHTKEKPFQCNTCGKLFFRSNELKDHLRVHIKTKPLCVMDAVRHLR